MKKCDVKWQSVPRIKSAKVSDELKLMASFSCGTTKQIDMRKFRDFPPYKPLFEDKNLFNNFKVCGHGVCVIWNDEIDIAHEAIWFEGEQVGMGE